MRSPAQEKKAAAMRLFSCRLRLVFAAGDQLHSVIDCNVASPQVKPYNAGMKMLPVLLLCLPLLAQAEWGDFDYEFEQDKPWVEVATQLPAYPKPENLIPFSVSSVTGNRFLVDAASISVGEDKVVRYTVVIETTGGARNVSFEGLRCESGERRLYAYGHPDGTWSKARARNAGWEAIKFRSLLSYQKALFEDHFCPDGIRVKDGAEAVRNLKRAAP